MGERKRLKQLKDYLKAKEKVTPRIFLQLLDKTWANADLLSRAKVVTSKAVRLLRQKLGNFPERESVAPLIAIHLVRSELA